MQLDFLLSQENAGLLDPVYNHKQICELLVQEGEAQTIAQFRQQSRILDTLSPEHISELRCIFLNSLNRSLYNFILFTWDISLAGCCFQNKAMTHAFSTREVFEEAGAEIIRTYSRCLKDYSSNQVYIAKALGYINEHLDEDLSLSSVARHIFISPCYLCKIFKPLTGQTLELTARRVNVTAIRALPEDSVPPQLDLFTDTRAAEQEKSLQRAMLRLRKRYGKNAVLRGHDLQEGATTIQRNSQIGGHRA